MRCRQLAFARSFVRGPSRPPSLQYPPKQATSERAASRNTETGGWGEHSVSLRKKDRLRRRLRSRSGMRDAPERTSCWDQVEVCCAPNGLSITNRDFADSCCEADFHSTARFVMLPGGEAIFGAQHTWGPLRGSITFRAVYIPIALNQETICSL